MIAYGQVLTTTLMLLIAATSFSWSAESSYSKLDFDRHCRFEKPASEEEAGMGASGICKVGKAPAIYFEDGDLRHSAGFGAPKPFQSFSQFNQVNTTIEWRSKGGQPYGAIVRWFIENINPDTGIPDKKHKGQVLVVHRVAENRDGKSCIVGVVDARANANANVMARRIADQIAQGFVCGRDRAKYHGNRGKYAGDLTQP